MALVSQPGYSSLRRGPAKRTPTQILPHETADSFLRQMDAANICPNRAAYLAEIAAKYPALNSRERFRDLERG